MSGILDLIFVVYRYILHGVWVDISEGVNHGIWQELTGVDRS